MFDVQGSLTITTVKLGSGLAGKFEEKIKQTVNQASKGAVVDVKLNMDSTQAKAALTDVKNLSKDAIDPLKKGTEAATKATDKLNASIKKTGTASGGANKDLVKTENIFDKLSKQAESMLTFSLVAGVFFQLSRAIGSSVNSIIRFEKDIVNVTKVMNVTAVETEQLEDAVKSLGVTFGFSLGEAANAAAVYAQQGKSMNEVISLTEASMLLANISILTTTESTEALTAIINQFGFSANEVVRVIDSLNEVANKYAVTEADITEAIKRSGAAAEEAGVSFEKFSGYVATLQEKTRRGGRVIGTALKTIFARLNTDKAVKALREVGIESFNLEGNFTNLGDRLDQVAARWEGLNNVQRVSIATAIAGKRRYSDFLSLMSGYDTSIGATETALNAQNSAMIENEKIMGTLDKTLKSLSTTWDSFVVSLSDSGISTTIGLVAKSFQGIGAVLSAIPPEAITALLGAGLISGGRKLGGSIAKQGGSFIASRKEAALVRAKEEELRVTNKAVKGVSLFDKTVNKVAASISNVGVRLSTQGERIPLLKSAGKAVASSPTALFGVGIGANKISEEFEEDSVGRDVFQGVASTANTTALLNISGITEKIAGFTGTTASSMNLYVIAATAAYQAIKIAYGYVEKWANQSKETFKELKKIEQIQKSLRKGFVDIQNVNKGSVNNENIDKQIAIFDKLAEKSNVIDKYRADFIKAAASGEGLKKVLQDIDKEVNREQRTTKRKADKEAFDDLERTAKKDIALVVPFFTTGKEDIDNIVKDTSKSISLYTNAIKQIPISAETTAKQVDSIANAQISKAISKISNYTYLQKAYPEVAKLLVERIVNSVEDEASLKKIKLGRIIPKEEADRIGSVIDEYNNKILSVELAIDKSKEAHERYAKFIDQTSEVIGDVDLSKGVGLVYERLKEAESNISRLDLAGVIDKDLLDPFVKEVEFFQKKGSELSTTFSGDSAKNIVKNFSTSGASAQSPLGQVAGLIIKNALGNNTNIRKLGEDPKYSRGIQDTVKRILGTSFDPAKIKELISSSNIGFATAGTEGLKGILSKLKDALGNSSSKEQELLAVREASIEISKKIIDTQEEVNNSYERLVNGALKVVSVNNSIAGVRNRIIDLELRGSEKLQISNKKIEGARKLQIKNLEIIASAEKASKEKNALVIEDINKRLINGSEAHAKAMLGAQAEIRAGENDLAKARIDAIEEERVLLAGKLSDLDSKISDTRTKTERRALTTVDDRIDQERALSTAFSALRIDPSEAVEGVRFSKEQKNRLSDSTIYERDEFIKNLKNLAAQGGRQGNQADAVLTGYFGSKESDSLEDQRRNVIKESVDLNKQIKTIYEGIKENTYINLVKEKENIDHFKIVLDRQDEIHTRTLELLNKDKDNIRNRTVYTGLDNESKPILPNGKKGDAPKPTEISDESADKIGKATAKYIKSEKTAQELNVKGRVEIGGDNVADAVLGVVEAKIKENREAIDNVIRDSIREGRNKKKIIGD